MLGFFAFLISGLPPMKTLHVSAEVFWDEITDENFTNGWSVTDMETFEGDLYFIQDGGSPENIYKYDSGTDLVTIANQDMIGDELVDFVMEIEFANGLLFASISKDGNESLYAYDGTDWLDITESLGDSFLDEIHYLGNFDGELLVQVSMDSEGAYMLGAVFDGTDWTDITDIESFDGIDNSSMYIENIAQDDENTYLKVFDDMSGVTGVYRYLGGVNWEAIAGVFEDLYYSNLIIFQGELFITTDDYNQELSILRYDSDLEDWVFVDMDFGDEQTVYAEIAELDGVLYLATTQVWGGLAEVYKSEDGLNWELHSHYIGDSDDEDGQEVSWVTSMITFNDTLALGTSRPGEGPYYTQVWLMNESDDEADDDGDGISNGVEDAGPNGGDANNDEIQDSQQSNVTSQLNPVTESYMVLETTCASNSNVQVGSESSEHPDAAFDYDMGLASYILECDEGETADITFYFYGTFDATLYVARKWIPGESYITIDSAEFTNTIIDGESVLTMSYQVTDGGELDDDGEVNGVIVDPVGPALNAAGVPNTGIGGFRN